MEEEVGPEEGRPDAMHETPEASGLAWWSVLGIVVVAVAIGFVVMDGLKSETYFYTVDAAMAQGPDLSGQHVRIKGTVEPGSVIGNDGELGRTFRIAENGKSISVTYNRAMPDTFDENMEVVVQGIVNDKMIVEADEVLVKCPSRYEGNPPTAHDKQASL